MKLCELVEAMNASSRIRRKGWWDYLVKGLDSQPLLKIDIADVHIQKYSLTYEDLVANDWELI